MINRYYGQLDQYLAKNKVLVIYGPRQVGKTTLVETFLQHTALRYKIDSGENLEIQHLLSSQNFKPIINYVSGYDLIVIDEAQNIPQIGMALKIIVDQIPDIQVIATGSSSFDLANSIGEPLTGRKRTITLYPIAQLELLQQYNRYELQQRLPEYLMFGAYPEVLQAKTTADKIRILRELMNSYILKDILALEQVKGSKVLLDLLKLLAFQIGHEVSHHELATQLGINTKTVQRYLDLFEKTFIIIARSAWSRNKRKEISKKQKYYFLDLGIRNALIGQFNPLEQRNDVGQLWENFIIIERLKIQAYQDWYGTAYFWRTYSGQEIDLVEEYEGKITAFECKWSIKKKVKLPSEWQRLYPDTGLSLITPENYLDFII